MPTQKDDTADSGQLCDDSEDDSVLEGIITPECPSSYAEPLN